MPESIKETFIIEEGIKLKPETMSILSDLFTATDKEFAYGINKKLLKKVFVYTNTLQSEKDKEDFYNEGPYRRKLNQRLCGLNLKDFLQLFERSLKKMQKKDPTMTEDELLRRLIEGWGEAKRKALLFEDKILKIRPELRKAGTVFEDDKRTVIAKMLKNPGVAIDQVDKELANTGFYGLSLKDKLLLIEYQIQHQNMKKTHYEARLKNEILPAKTMKFEKKIKDIEENVRKQEEILKEYQQRFKDIFQKQKTAEENKAAEEAEEKVEKI